MNMNKIKFKDIISAEKENKKCIVNVNDVEIEITEINTADYMRFVLSVTEACFDENEEYRAEVKEIALTYAALKYFTNIDISDVAADIVFDNSWQLENVMYAIKELGIYKSLCVAVDEAVEYRIKNRKTSFDLMCDGIKVAFEKISANLSDMDYESIKTLAEKLNGITDEETVKAVLQSVKENE